MPLFDRVPRAARLASLLTPALLALGCGVALAAYGPARSLRAASDALRRLDAFARVRAAGTDGGGRAASPSALQANGKIAFVSERGGGQRDIFVMNLDGTGQTNASNNPAFDGEPAFSPDGAKIVFLSDRDGNDEIYVMNADGTNQTRLTNDAAFDFEPAFSPDGGKIVFTSDRSGNEEIHVMNSDGSGLVNLTNHSGHERAASFSPDGGKIVFVSTRDGGDGEIYVMNADGTNQTRLTTTGGYDPTFSPDGGKIAFTDASSGISAAVALMDADGTNKISLTGNAASDGNPSFSPDGTKIAFESDRDGDEEIYVMNVDGSGPTRLTSVGGADIDPAWQTLLSCAPPPANGVAWYRAEGDANDSIGTNHGTPQNGAAFAPGLAGQAFSFDGADDFVEVPNSSALSPTAALTIAAWIRTGGSDGRIVDKITAATSNGYLLDVDGGKLRLLVGAAVVSSAQSLPPDTFVHVAGTYDGATARIYINGVQAGSVAGGGPIPTNSEPLRIGIASDGTAPFLGLVDEVDIFSRALSAAEVGDIYDAKGAGKCLASASQTITASNTNDSGPGSLRQAILDANASPGTQTITFNIPGPGVKTISPASALPAVTDPVVIDGYTQPGASPNTLAAGSDAVLLVELDGTGAGAGASGLDITAGNSTVRGLVINRFAQHGIRLAAAHTNTVEGNFIGTDAAAAAGLGNGNGVLVESSSVSNTIGGTTPAARNVIAANQIDNVKIAGSRFNNIRGNYVGTNAAGTSALGGSVGVRLDNAANGNFIGGASAGARNLISGHANTGVLATGGSTSNHVEGNYIGTNFDGTSAVANASDGIELDATSIPVGGTAAGAGNLIAFNGRNGVRVSAGASNAIRGNTIHSNGGLGIDLGGDDVVTANDANDSDAGANNSQNFPVLTSVFNGDGTTHVTGTLNSTASTTFRIEFFTNPACDASGHGEGKTFIGSASVTTDGSGSAQINATLAGTVAAGVSVTATATSSVLSEDTSEFSACRQPDAGPGALAFGAARFDADEGEGTATIRVARTGGTDGAVSVDYAATGGTASASADYTLAAGTLTFSPGQASKTFTVALVNDSTLEQVETVQLALSNPTGGATVGPPAASTLFIGDDEGTFTNSAPITINDSAPAAPYPSTINVSGFPANVDKAVVKLHDLSHTYLTDVEVMLVGPAGQKIVLMSAESDGNTVSNLTLTFDDDAPGFIPPAGDFSSGRYKPAASGTRAPTFPAPAPGGPYGNALSPLQGTDPNGTWSLYVHDTAGGDTGLIGGGWSLTFSPLPPTTFNLGGQIVEGAGGLPGVTVTLSGSQAGTTTTDANGNYSFANLPAGGNYTVTPSLANYTFAPPSQTFNSLAADQTAGFTATRNTHALAGRVADAGNNPLAGVLLTLGGSQSATTTSDAAGNYSFANLPAGGSYTVTPSLANHTFAPPSAAFANLGADGTADFTGTLDVHVVAGQIKDNNNAALAGVTVTLSGSQSGTTTTDAAGNYSFANVPAGGSYTVTPALTNYTFAPPSLSFSGLAASQTADFTGTLDVHVVAGRVADGANVPLGGVTLTLSGSQSATTTTDAGGNYSFNLPAGGSYTVTPSFANHTFAPPSRTINNLSANQTQLDFTGTLNTYGVGGRVTENGNNLAGVTVTLSGSQSATTTTDAAGNYSFNLPAGGNYTVTPSLANHTFAPPSLSFNDLSGNRTGDFAATRNTHAVSGRIRDDNNAALGGVTVTLSGAQSATTTTDAAGNYSFANLPAGGAYTVTPSLANYGFAPTSRTLGNLSADQTADFAASLNTYAVSGRAVDASNNALAGVTVTLSGARSASTLTDANGAYSFASLPAGASYTVTPSLANHTFAPPSRVFNNLQADAAGNFAGTLNTHAITGRVADGANSALAGVSVTLSGSQSAATQTDASGNYSFANLPAGGSYTVTPSRANYAFAPPSRAFDNLSSDQIGDFAATLDTFTISGRVADAVNAPLAGVTVSLGGAAARTAQTDARGNYSFASVPAGGSYTVTPALAGYAFAPPSLAFANLTADAAANFSARISVSTPAGTNVSITTPAATLTFAQVSNAGMTSVTPADPAAAAAPPQGYSFPPSAPSVDIATTATTSGLITVCLSVPAFTDPAVFAGLRLLHGEGGVLVDRTSSSDFASKTICAQTASLSPFAVAFAQPAAITGRATDPQGGPLPGVAVTLSGAQSTQTTTDANGNYSFANLPGAQTYTVTAAKTNFTFAPPAYTFGQLTGNAAADFTGSGAFTIRGRVSSPTVEGVTVTLSGTRSAVEAVGPNGEFAFDNLPRGGTYKVRPQGGALSFAPPEREFANLLDDARADFDAAPLANPTPTPPVADDFAGGARDPQKFAEGTLTQPSGATDPLVTVEQRDGKLVITPRPNFTGLSFNGYVAVAAVDFTNATASIQVDQIAAGGAQTIFSVGADDQNFYRFVAQEQEAAAPASPSANLDKRGAAPRSTLQQLLLQVRAAGVFNSLSIPYDPVAHKFWRFRHDAAASPAPAMLFEVSPTGLDGSWSAVRVVPVAGAIGALATEISVGTTTTVSQPGQAVFDNLNLVPDQTPRRAGAYRLSAESLTVAEGAGSFTVRVARSGASLGESTVEVASEPYDGRVGCSAFDGKARARCDYTTTFARLRFAPGETEKAVTVFLTDDSYAEGPETFRLALGNASAGYSVESPAVTVTVVDNDQPGARNPIDSADFFVRQQYLDFLSREPDAGGFAAWTNVLRQCAFEGHFGPGKSGSDSACDRITVSSGFYRSGEFHARGFFAYRFYEVALGRRPTYEEFLSDMQLLSGPQSPEELEASKETFVREFMSKPGLAGQQSFAGHNGEFDGAARLDHMLERAGLTLANRDQLASALAAGRMTPAQVLRAVAESSEASAKFYNRAFVAMQYFGYLQRDPEEAGFNAWVNVLNTSGDYRAMIFGFIYSHEYRARFGPAQ